MCDAASLGNVHEQSQIDQIELNPLIVGARRRDCFAVDARISIQVPSI